MLFIFSSLLAFSLVTAPEIDDTIAQNDQGLKRNSLSSSIAASGSTNSTRSAEPSCEKGTASNITFKHREHNGVGYTDGFSTAAAFLALNRWDDSWLPFIDLRAHIFNDGHFAGNAGIGCRVKTSHWVFGGNAYYDCRDASRLPFLHQISGGFEALCKLLELRVNGYAPVGNSKRYGHVKFSHFK